MNLFWIFLGGGLGSLARWWISGIVSRHWGETFPWGTLAVNVAGSLAIGLAAALTSPEGRWLAPAHFRAFFMVGLCGGFTTFSSFSLQTLALLQDGQWLRALLNAGFSVLLCLVAVVAGFALGTALSSPTR